MASLTSIEFSGWLISFLRSRHAPRKNNLPVPRILDLIYGKNLASGLFADSLTLAFEVHEHGTGFGAEADASPRWREHERQLVKRPVAVGWEASIASPLDIAARRRCEQTAHLENAALHSQNLMKTGTRKF
jgi:hypothetical protein